MTLLRKALADYLAVRRALGYRLIDAERILGQFVSHVEERGGVRLTTEAALAWATLPPGAHRCWHSKRLSLARQFARYLRGIDPATEVPPEGLLPGKNPRAVPYLYSDEDIRALLVATGLLRGSHRIATYRTLIALLSVTGMRIGEAIGLDCSDFDSSNGFLTIRNGKFGKSRELPLHQSTAAALSAYLGRHDRPCPQPDINAFFISPAGTRLRRDGAQKIFQILARRAGLAPRSAACRPRLHDLRHGFAVNTILDGYRNDGDPGARLALLSTYLGHIDPGMTYWYLSAAPELLKLAGDRLERHLGGGA